MERHEREHSERANSLVLKTRGCLDLTTLVSGLAKSSIHINTLRGLIFILQVVVAGLAVDFVFNPRILKYFCIAGLCL